MGSNSTRKTYVPAPLIKTNGNGNGNGINTNSYISFSLLLALLGGFWAVLNSLYSARADLASKQAQIEIKVDDSKARIESMEKNKETWDYQDMFRWAVHLQRDNPSMKVPEPSDK